MATCRSSTRTNRWKPTRALRIAGLDWLGAVELLGSSESAYDIHFANEARSLDTFATPAVLWETVARLQTAA